ncbi:MAG: hypothetical protein DMD81_17630, partial [Candidatus Rokuibacteriota bacterium]
EQADALSEVVILHISDFQGQLIPLSEPADTLGAPATNPPFAIGGAAFLKPWFETYKSEAALGKPNNDGVIVLTAGDSLGASPAISAFFGDTPTVEIMNMMGFDVDGLGNHDFDKGQDYLRHTLIPLARYPFVSANIVDNAGKTPREWSRSRVFKLGRGVRLGIVGFSNDDLPTLTNPANLPPFHVTNPTAAAASTDAIVAIGHLGATGGTLTAPTGPLVDLVDNVSNVDAVIGDHTDFQVLTTRPNGVLVTENFSKGTRFTRLRLVIGPGNQGVVYKTADFHEPWDIGVTPDAAIQARIDDLNTQLGPILATVIGNSPKFIPNADQCGNSDGRTCESLIGNVAADAMRIQYAAIGVEFAIMNSGGLRTDLTCPTTDNPDDFCPAYTPPPYLITRGQVLSVLPFGNAVATLTVNGAELKTMLENGVSAMPAAHGKFPQVSGLCFTYDISAPAGTRVTSVVRQAVDGRCTGPPVDLTAAATYKIAENDFMASGGDDYPVFAGRATTQDTIDQAVADYITAHSPINPVVNANGRINCTTSGSPSCPVLIPSP